MIAIDEHLILRPYEVADFEALYAAVDGSRQHLNKWLPWVAATTRPEHSMEFIQKSMQELHDQQSLVMGMFYDDELVGGVGMHEWHHDTKRAQVGYWISKDHEGRGIVTRSLEGFIGYLFSAVGLNKLEIHYVAANKRSGAVAQRLGFVTEGLIRQSAMRNGVTEDVVVTGLLRQEWKQSRR